MIHIGLETIAQRRTFDVEDTLCPELAHSIEVAVEHIVGLVLPSNRRIRNNFALSRMQRFVRPNVTDSLTLSPDKANRFVKLFSELRKNHELECHDLIAKLEDVHPLHDDLPDPKVIYSEADIISGVAYSIFTVRNNAPPGTWRLTHSCLGTDNKNLLSIHGEGGGVTLMDMEGTRDLWGYGNASTSVAEL